MIGFPECTCFCTLSTYFYVHRISVIGSLPSELDLLSVRKGKKNLGFMVSYTIMPKWLLLIINRRTGI
jgi:hypothetical protein